MAGRDGTATTLAPFLGELPCAEGLSLPQSRLRSQAPARRARKAYPSRPITLVVPLAVGGSTDVIGRIIAEGMRAALGQPVIVENVTGAGGTIGVGRVARAAPDGYTIGIGQWGTNVATGAIYPLPFDLLKDFEPVALIATQPFLIVGKKTVPANDLTELIAWLKANQTRSRRAIPASARRATSAAYCSRTPSARASRWCPIAAPGSRCRTWWPGSST